MTLKKTGRFKYVRLGLAAVVVVFLLTGILLFLDPQMASSKALPKDVQLPEAIYADEPVTIARLPDATEVINQITAALMSSLKQQMQEWQERMEQAQQERFREPLQVFLAWRQDWEKQGELRHEQIEKLQEAIRLLTQEVAQLQETRQSTRANAAEKPSFYFRGIEIWHGQVYALLEYEGRIMPARQGESRLGWRIHEIDRERRQLHVSNGSHQYVLEAS